MDATEPSFRRKYYTYSSSNVSISVQRTAWIVNITLLAIYNSAWHGMDSYYFKFIKYNVSLHGASI